MKIFDTHTHYDDKAYNNNADELINRILSDNVAGFIAIGANIPRSLKSVQIAERYETVYAAAGVHPHDVEKLPRDYIEQLEKMAKSPKVKAIGEIGLDYHYDGYDREIQIQRFKEQLSLAERLNLPIVIHSRDANEDALEIIRECAKSPNFRAVMHCYSGSVEYAKILQKLGVLISFTGVITFKNAKKAIQVCQEMPLEMIMLETDCPYMAPEPHRGKTCDSSMTIRVAEKIAEIKGISADEVISVCNNNAKKFFDINF